MDNRDRLDYIMQHDPQMLGELVIQLMIKAKSIMASSPQAYTAFKNAFKEAAKL